MSSSEHNTDRQVHRLIIQEMEPGIEVIVIDAEGCIVERSADDQSQLEWNLPRGLYTVRTNRSGLFEEIVIRHEGEQTVKAQVPKIFSAATIPGAETTHEYYAYPAWEASQKLTSSDHGWSGNQDAGLLLFIRGLHAGMQGFPGFANLSLHLPNGETLSKFDSNVLSEDKNKGWSAYSTRLSHSLLILEDGTKQPRQMPVLLMKGWQTQLFLMHSGRLLWEDLRMTMVADHDIDSRQYRNPYNDSADDVRTAMYMDAGLLGLQNNNTSVARNLIDYFLGAKFPNPMLGLLGAYLLLQQYNHDPRKIFSKVKPDPSLIYKVLHKLHALMPRSADVTALRLMAKELVELPMLEPVESVPQFRRGAEVLLHASAADPGLVPDGSLLDVVSENLFGDTVLTTWKPILLPARPRFPLNLDSSSAEFDYSYKKEGLAFGGVLSESGAERDSIAEKSSWVLYAVMDAIVAGSRGKELTFVDLVRRIGVSPHAIRSAILTLLYRASLLEPPTNYKLSALSALGTRITPLFTEIFGKHLDDKLRSFLLLNEPTKAQKRRPSEIFINLVKIFNEFVDLEKGRISVDKISTEIINPDGKRGQ